MAPVSIAPLIRRALHQRTAKEPPTPVNGVYGKFWAPDSDSEYEDLGDADDLAQGVVVPPSPPIQQPASTSSINQHEKVTSSLQRHSPLPATTSISPKAVRAPWKGLWKGPLPPRRTTPAATFGDFILPALQRRVPSVGGRACGHDRRTADRDRHIVRGGGRDPASKGFQISNLQTGAAGPQPTEPNRPRQATTHRVTPAHATQPRPTPTPVLCGPKRRLIDITAFHTAASPVLHAAAASRPSYRDALMAGNRGYTRGRAIVGRGAQEHRRGRGRGPPPDAHGRDRVGQGPGRGARGGSHATEAEGRGRGRGGSKHTIANNDHHDDTAAPEGATHSAPGRNSAQGGGQGAGHRPQGGGRGRGVNPGANLDTSGTVLDDEQGKQKRKRKDQSVRLECSICTEEHYTNQCPLLRGPKPTVAYCGAAEDGMGFFHIQAARNNQIVMPAQSSVAALITVEAGEVSAQLLHSELARIIPIRWDWEVQVQGANSFVVPFPSSEELERMIAIRAFTTKNKEGTIIFEEFIDDVQPIRVLDKVWITVTNVPRVLRSFLPLWAVGSIIGATQKVDMVHLRATGQVRILVAVMDIKKIPKLADVCAINSIYRLYFKPDEVVQHDAFDPEDDDLLGDTDKGAEGEDREMEDADNPDPTSENNNSKSDKAPAPSQNMTHQQLACLVNKALDMACEELINEISIRVMLEPDDETLRKNYTPLSEEELTAYNNLVNSLTSCNLLLFF